MLAQVFVVVVVVSFLFKCGGHVFPSFISLV